MKLVNILNYLDYLKKVYPGESSAYNSDFSFRETCLEHFFSDSFQEYSYSAYHAYCVKYDFLYDDASSAYDSMRFRFCIDSFADLGSEHTSYLLYSKSFTDSELQQLAALERFGYLSNSFIKRVNKTYGSDMQLNFLKVKEFCNTHASNRLLKLGLCYLFIDGFDVDSACSQILDSYNDDFSMAV